LTELNTRIKQFFGRPNRWAFLIFLAVLLIGTPVFTILFQLFKGGGESWGHIVSNLLADYVINSILLVINVSVLALFFGVSTAWLVTTCNFPFRGWFEWLLILPLSIPTYIAAFAYAGLFDFNGWLQSFFGFFGFGHIDIMNKWGVSFVMAMVLYPYVYVVSRSAFLNQSRSLLESARILGSSSWRTFFTIAIPVTRPAIIGGLTLVIMEVFNDYGAVKYYGVSTFTTGIFRAWFSLGDAASAIKLSAILLLFVFLLIMLERLQRGDAAYEESRRLGRPLKRYDVHWLTQLGILLFCSIPFIAGFLLPLMQLLSWSWATMHKVVNQEFWRLIFNSFTLAFMAAALAVFISVLLIYAVRINKGLLWRSLAKLVTLGYSIPGAVIAIGVMVPFIATDRFFIRIVDSLFGHSIGLILSGSLFALIFAYIVRFIAVAYNPVDGGFKKTGEHIEEASRSLGIGSVKTLWKVDLPLIRPAIGSALLLVFVDVLKELPLTLILRPFNYHTLATKAYEYASDEMIAESAGPALIIILTGLLPIILLNRLMTQNKRKWAY
jgi:iron(III) transport system permease protein